MDRNGGLAVVTALEALNTALKQSIPIINSRPNQPSDVVTEDIIKPETVANLATVKHIDRDEKVVIFVRVTFLKLGEIDTVGEKFSADAFIQARWREPRLDGRGQNMEFELLNTENFWNPKLSIDNAVKASQEHVWHIVAYDDAGLATVYQRRRVKGVFFEKMELMQYPFDTQDLTLTIASDRDASELELESHGVNDLNMTVATQPGEKDLDLHADDSQISTVSVQSFLDEQEWYLHEHIRTSKNVKANIYKNSKHNHPTISISCRASRRSRFFVWNIVLVMVFICSLVFATFTVNVAKPENRLQLSFTLLLSNITFKFTVSQTLPKISYLTYLDKYILVSMFIICLVCVWHALVDILYSVYGEDVATTADMCALAILGGSYFIFNLAFFLYIYNMNWKKKKDFKTNTMNCTEPEATSHRNRFFVSSTVFP